jgi:Domain of unknown function (DUF1995)
METKNILPIIHYCESYLTSDTWARRRDVLQITMLMRSTIGTTIIRCLVISTTVALSTAFVLPGRTSGRSWRLVHNNGGDPSACAARGLLWAAARPTELPDSLADAAVRAAEATQQFYEQGGGGGVGLRCRVDFDTTIGDETYTLLKSSTEFMQEYVSALCYGMIPGLKEERMKEMMAVASAKAELKALEKMENNNNAGVAVVAVDETKEDELIGIINRNGRSSVSPWNGPLARIYFPDEGSAALARRDWLLPGKVPVCCVMSSCGGVQLHDLANDKLVFFFCPKATEAANVEAILAKYGESPPNNDLVRLMAFVNPRLVDMGVTGFGMAGRLLRERLIDPLVSTYYLRTLQWGALTRKWPDAFSVYQEDTSLDGGYRLIKVMNRLPSNPEVEDIYDIENGLQNAKPSGGILDQLGDFVNGMMRL